MSFARDAAIRLGEAPREAGARPTRWGLILVVFMRLMAGLWLCQGLVEWASIVLPQETMLKSMPGTAAAAVIFFAIADLVAAVGLWLATPWGGALWLFAATSQIFVATTVKDSFASAWVAIDVFLIVIYFVLTFKASQARDG
ncbi:MAG: DUF6163 family protein [Methylovirgula sp.]